MDISIKRFLKEACKTKHTGRKSIHFVHFFLMYHYWCTKHFLKPVAYTEFGETVKNKFRNTHLFTFGNDTSYAIIDIEVNLSNDTDTLQLFPFWSVFIEPHDTTVGKLKRPITSSKILL